jgi:hypothetical protein
MDNVTFCPFINGECRPDCVFRSVHNIALNNGKTAKCELAALICCSDETTIHAVLASIKALHDQA